MDPSGVTDVNLILEFDVLPVDAPHEVELQEAQRADVKRVPMLVQALGLMTCEDGLLVTRSGGCYVPDMNNLRVCLLVAAHTLAGLAGHRGIDTTYFTWPMFKLALDVRWFCRACLMCAWRRRGKMIP